MDNVDIANEYIPILMNSRIRRGSEEGTEIIAKHVEITRKKLPGYHAAKHFMWFGLLLVWFSFYFLGLSWIFGVTEILGIMMLISGLFLYAKKERVIRKEKEPQIPIFIPRILLSDISQISGIFPGPHEDWGYPEPTERKGYIQVKGNGYNVVIHDEELYDKIIQERRELEEEKERKREWERSVRNLIFIYKAEELYEKAAELYEMLGELDMAEVMSLFLPIAESSCSNPHARP